jgi:hypothetical protein
MRSRNHRPVFLVLYLLALSGLALTPAQAQNPPILHGVDLLETSTTGGTSVSFAGSPIPAGFFCTGSAAFAGTIGLKGVPLATIPAGAAGTADTIIERPANTAFGTGGVANVQAIVRALSLTSTANLTIACPGSGTTQWRADACLCGTQPTNTLQATLSTSCGNACGSFNGQLRLNVCLRFTRIGTTVTAGPITQAVILNVNATPWCYRAGPGSRVAAAFTVDTNCDGVPDLSVPASSNFFPGWGCGTQGNGLTCLQQYAALTHCHPNFTNPGSHDHCVNPVCDQTH